MNFAMKFVAGGLLMAAITLWSPALAAPPTVGQTFRDCPDTCPEMVVVPSGTFTMGSLATEEGRQTDEGPMHSVILKHPFAVGKFELTFAEWDACVADGGCRTKPADAGWGRGRRPVINVSWHDAQNYVAWLGRKTGYRYRLLSEAEWEYAARGGTTTPWSTGEAIITDDANFLGQFNRTVPVGGFPANGYGLHDVHGNVWEWTQDCVDIGYFGVPNDGSPSIDGDCKKRNIRGGGFDSSAANARSANRTQHLSSVLTESLGLRVARSLYRLDGVAITKGEDAPPAMAKAPPGPVFRECTSCPEMVRIPGGSFTMGAPNGGGYVPPQVGEHRVTVQPYAIGKYEVTFAEWDACVADGGCPVKSADYGWGRGRRPVIGLSWRDAQEYVRWLSEKTNAPYRLVTEAEWDYAARGGDVPLSPALGKTWRKGNVGGRNTVEVGTFMANAFGLHEMPGNVLEMVEDCWHPTFVGAPLDGSAWQTDSCQKITVRGGAWLYPHYLSRLAARYELGATEVWSHIGFRVARTLTAAEN